VSGATQRTENAAPTESRLLAGPSGRRWILTASVVLIFMTGFEGTVVATAMPTIISQLGGFDLFSWVFSGYFLAQGVTIPIYGRLADLFGRKRILFFGLSLFLIGTTLCGFAPNMLSLVICRIIQGLGAGAVQPINQTVIGDLYPPAMRERPGIGSSGSASRSASSRSCCSPLRCTSGSSAAVTASTIWGRR
jgi:MFS family permease